MRLIPRTLLFSVLCVALALALAPRVAAQNEKPTQTASAWVPLPHEGHCEIKVRVSHARVAPGSTVLLEFEMVPEFEWHIYGKKETNGPPPKVKLDQSSAVTPKGTLDLPDGDEHESFGIVSYWIDGPIIAKQAIEVPWEAQDGPIDLMGTISYMACTKENCDPEIDVPFRIALDIAADAPVVNAGGAGKETEAGAKGKGNKEADAPKAGAGAEDTTSTGTGAAGATTGSVAGGAAGGAPNRFKSIWGFLAAAFGAGLFALVMPCTYPMIPITISFFTKQADSRGGSVLPLALTYGIGIILIFVVIGVVAGGAIVPFATHWITNLAIGILFLVFGLSLFGLIDIQPPRFLMNAAASASSKGGYVGVFLMGLTLVITSFTCTAPFVGIVLASGAQSFGLETVALGMGVFGATMAFPFVLLSLVPSQLKAMPKSGNWMNTLKVFLGFVEIAAALKFFSNAEVVWDAQLLPRELFLTIWAGIFFAASLFLLGFIKLKGETGDIGPGRMSSGLAVMLLAFYFFHGSQGYKLDNQVMLAFEPPYKSVRFGNVAASAGKEGAKKSSDEGAHEVVKDDYDKAVEIAKSTGKKVLINFTGFT